MRHEETAEAVEYDEDTMLELRIKSLLQYQDFMRRLYTDDDGEEDDCLSSEEESEVPETSSAPQQSEKPGEAPLPEQKEKAASEVPKRHTAPKPRKDWYEPEVKIPSLGIYEVKRKGERGSAVSFSPCSEEYKRSD